MKIKLNNIGIVHDSTMMLEGLTVITGKNNSGKTTVGKALYSLLDAVSNLSAKARNDREQYVVNQLENVIEAMDLFRFFSRAVDFEDTSDSPFLHYPTLAALFSGEYRHEFPRNEIEAFARKLHQELLTIDIQELSRVKTIQYIARHISEKEKSSNDIGRMIAERVEKASSILEELFKTLEKDPQLIEYARESINQTLNMEFSGQIQPASIEVEESRIEIYENDNCCFSIEIRNNKVVNRGAPSFYSSPYKKTFFIDNPFLFDEPSFLKRYLRNPIGSDAESFLNPNNIVSHNNKLKYVLRSSNKPTVLEQTIIDDSLEKVKKEIDKILPGTFEFSSNGDYYVQNGKKLKMTNLATGSKMFSIIKLLLEKGHLDKSTMLILDEPEAHLHPSWQNRFAEMIVLLVKELEVNILLTTHSSNFVLALDAYMRKHSITEKTNFYRTEFNDEKMVDYICTNDDIGIIYQDFLEYLSEVKVLRNECLKNAGENS